MDVNVFCLEGVVIGQPYRMIGEWLFRLSVEDQVLRVRSSHYTALHIGDRVWVSGRVEDGMITRLISDEVRILNIDEDGPGTSGGWVGVYGS